MGYPTPNIIWYRQVYGHYHEIIKNNPNHKIINTVINEATTRSDVLMFNITSANSGRYWCYAVNSVGIAKLSARVIVRGE